MKSYSFGNGTPGRWTSQVRSKLWRVCAALSLSAMFIAPAAANTFTANGGAGSSTVGGVSDDYPDLASAAEDFTTGPQAVTGDYTFYITTDTVENRQFSFGKATNGRTITVKPAPGVQPTVTFQYPKQNNNTSTFGTGTGFPGQFIIGVNDLSATAAALNGGVVPTDGFVIDGSNTVNGTTRDLSFVVPNTGLINARAIHIIGSNGCTVKNCKITNLAGNSYGIYVAATKYPVSGTAAVTQYFSCNGAVIDNNEVSATGNGGCGAIYVNAIYDGQVNVNSYSPGQAPSGYSITNNVAEGRNRVIGLNFAGGGTITGNKLSGGNSSSNFNGYGHSAISHNNTLGETGWTINISNNEVTTITVGSSVQSVAVINLGNATDTGSGTYNVTNNMIAGIEGAGSNSLAYSAIVGRADFSVYNIQHNSINMDDTPGISPTGDNAAAIAITSGERTTATTVLRNNLLRQGQHNGIGIDHAPSVSLLTTNGNDVYTVAGATFGLLEGTSEAALADWQSATSQESLGATLDPAATSGSSWSSSDARDLHFTPSNVVPVGLDGGVPTSTTGVTTDIDGETRNSASPVRGADEVIAGSAVSDWFIY